MKVSFKQNIINNPSYRSPQKVESKQPAVKEDYDTFVIKNLSSRSKSAVKVLAGIAIAVNIIYFTLKRNTNIEKFNQAKVDFVADVLESKARKNPPKLANVVFDTAMEEARAEVFKY